MRQPAPLERAPRRSKLSLMQFTSQSQMTETLDRDVAGVAVSAPVVALRDVRKVHGRGEGAVVALDGVTVGLARGSFTAIMGPSGSGKSTFLHMAAGLDRPTSGMVRLGGGALGEMSEVRLTELRRERVGFVFQAFNLLPALTVAQNIDLPQRLSSGRVDRAWRQ